MPCNTCDKDSGKFYGGSCPECLAERVRELETSNASLIGAVDGLIIESVLSTTAGRDYVERLKKLELVAEAVREYRDYAWKPYNHRTFSQEVLGSLKKRVCDSLTALDGDGNG